MSDELIKRLRDIGEEETGYGIRNEAADLIEQQAAEIVNLKHDIERHIANHAADLNAVAPAVDAQPVAWIDEYALRSLESNATAVCAPIGMRDENQTIPLYASAPSEGLRKDAERYRWLRQEHFPTADNPPLAQVVWKAMGDRFSSRWLNMIDGNDLDASIDGALSQHKGERDD